MKKLLSAIALAGVMAGAAFAYGEYVGPEKITSGMAAGTRYDAPPYASLGVPAGRPDVCREACRGDLRCYAWDYRTARRGEASSQCELHASVPTLVWDDHFISGEIGRSQPAPDPDEQVAPRTPDTSGHPQKGPQDPTEPSGDAFWSQYMMHEGSEVSGAAYASWTYIAKGDGGITRCAKACAGDNRCRAFVVRSDATVAPKPNVMCELKGIPGNLLRNADAVSGLKRN